MPSDEKRAYFAFSLAKAAFIFIILHEVGHLFWGHLSLISNYSEVNLISEDNTPNYKELTELDYQTLEIDADSLLCVFLLFLIQMITIHMNLSL